jgi:hypothetical protein
LGNKGNGIVAAFKQALLAQAPSVNLLQCWHEVTVVDRMSDAAPETSFANAAQIRSP